MKIFIDAGHNYAKWNTGATGNGLREQDITFEIAKILSNKLKAVGAETKLSREKITDILGTNNTTSLKTRVDMANNWGADLFISIHCNSSIYKSATGTEVYVYNKKSKTYGIAGCISKMIAKNLSLKDRGNGAAKTNSSLYVLKKTKMPSMLIETAFISNASDAQKLKNRKEDFAHAIYNEICWYYNLSAPKQEAVQETIKTTVKKPEPFTYHIEGTTHIIEVDPRNISAVETQCRTNKVTLSNFVNSVYFMAQANGIMYPLGIVVNNGQVVSNYITHGKPVATLIIHNSNEVEMKYVDDITKEKDVKFAVSGYGVYPNITAAQEGFTGAFADVLRVTDRPIIGYRKKDNKIVIAVRKNSNALRAQQTAKNLGLDFAISLDAGGSTTLKVNGKYKFKGDGRKIFGGITWA